MPGASEIHVSVVIPTYGRSASLPSVLAPLLDDPATGEVVVVADGDRAAYDLLANGARLDPRVRPVWQENRGETGARARGVAEARGELIVLLDDDVVAAPGLIGHHRARHAAQTDLIVVGYMPVAPVRGVAARLYARGYEATCDRWEADADAILPSLWAGNLSMRRDDAVRVGFSTGHRLDYHADLEFGLRCRAAGLRAEFDRTLVAEHRYVRSLAGLREDARRQGRSLAHLRRAHPAHFAAERGAPFSRAAASPFAPPTAAALSAGIRTAGRVGAPAVEERLADALIRLERRRAFVRATASAAPDHSASSGG